MTSGMTVRSICEDALRKIGAYTRFMSGADPEELNVACNFLDALVKHVTARPTQYLIEDELRFMTEAGTSKYFLSDILGAGYPVEGVQFPLHATVTQEGRDYDLKIETRQIWDDIYDKSITGRPFKAYIDRLEVPTVYLWPVPNSADYRVNIRFQRFANDLQIRSNLPSLAEKGIDLRQSWKLFLITGLAAEIGNGPVRSLPAMKIRSFQERADDLLSDLRAFEDTEHADEARLTRFNDPGL